MRTWRIACLTGGGAKGAFQVGVLSGLSDRGVVFDGYVGTSTGAIQAAWMCSGPAVLRDQRDRVIRLWRLWQGIRGNGDIYRNGWWRAAWRTIRKRPSVATFQPFRALVAQQLTKRPMIPVVLSTVSLDTGRHVAQRPTTVEGLRRAVLASAAIPVLLEPEGAEGFVDGGVREVAPLAGAFQLARELAGLMPGSRAVLYFISATPLAGLQHDELPEGRSGRDWQREPFWRVADRTLWIVSHEAIENDIQRATELNDLVRVFDARGWNRPPALQGKIYAPLIRFDPRHADVPYPTMQFDPPALARAYEAGYRAALARAGALP